MTKVSQGKERYKPFKVHTRHYGVGFSIVMVTMNSPSSVGPWTLDVSRYFSQIMPRDEQKKPLPRLKTTQSSL